MRKHILPQSVEKAQLWLGFFYFLWYNVMGDAKCWNVEKWNVGFLRS